jgi:hypothetical protein
LAERGPAMECSILVGHEQSAEPYLGELSDVGEVAASACGLPGSQHDSPAKIRDRETDTWQPRRQPDRGCWDIDRCDRGVCPVANAASSLKRVIAWKV